MRLAIFLLTSSAVLGACRDAPTNSEPSVESAQFQRASADLTTHGERLSKVLGCSGCHGQELTGEDFSEPGFGRLWTANLTRTAERHTDEELITMIRTGIRPDGSELWGMPSFLFTQLSTDDMAAVLAYVRSKAPSGEVHPRPVFEEGARQAIAAGQLKSSAAEVREQGAGWPPEAGQEHELARYIARATCAECHGLDLAGRERIGPGKPPPDLRIVAGYDRQHFDRLLRSGIAAGDRELELMSEVARGRYRHFTDQELNALHEYLQALGAPE